MPQPTEQNESPLLRAIRAGTIISDDELNALNTSYRDTSEIQRKTKASAAEALKTAEKQQFGFLNTIKEIPKSALDTFLHPVQSAKRVAGAAPDIALGIVDTATSIIPTYDPNAEGVGKFIGEGLITRYERAGFKGALRESGMSEEAVDSLYDAYMAGDPMAGGRTEQQRDARNLGGFLGYLIPYAAAENLAAKGLAFAAPKFVQNHSLGAKIVSSIVGNVGAAQATDRPDATVQERLERVPLDVAFGAAIPLLGPALRGAKNTIFRSIEKTRFGNGAVEPVIMPEGAKFKTGEAPTATVATKEGDVSISTNNVEAVRNYLKSSGKTNIILEERPSGTLGVTKEGLPVTARHIYNPKTNVHTMYVSSSADAETIAHEWGHYVNDSVARQVRGLSTYLFEGSQSVRNVGAIEDTLRALATKDLIESGTKTITPEMLDVRMGNLVASIRTEVRDLARMRPGDTRELTGTRQFSERLADAVSKALTGESALRRTSFFRFLQEAQAVDSDLVKALRGAQAATKRVEQAGDRTSLQKAVERKKEATTEKLGMGDKAPERAQRPPNRKYEPSKSEREEKAFSEVPQRIVARTDTQLRSAILRAKIPGKNLVEMQAKGKKPVTMLVHEIDGTILRAIQAGAESKYMQYAVRAVMKEYGISKRAAEAYISRRFRELKTYAENQAQEGQFVFTKAVRGGKEGGTAMEQGRISLEEGKAPREKTPEEIKAEDDARLEAESEAEAQHYTLAELELSEAGYRTQTGTGEGLRYGMDQWIGVPSTFPKWVPENLRSKDLFNKVTEMIENGTEPAKNATRQRELFDLIKQTIKERAPRYKEGQRAEIEDIRISEESALERERAAAEAEYESTLMNTPDTAQSGRTLAAAEGQPLKMNLDRMETGKTPETEAFRAEKMTDQADEEVFLNTKVLPEITGKFRIKRTNQDIIDQAQLSDMDEAQFLEMLQTRVGALTPDVRKGFEIAMDKAKTLQETLGGRSASDLTPDELVKFKQELSQAVQLFEVYSGIRTEASNLLRSFGISMQRGEDDVLRQIFEDLQKAGVASESDVFRAMALTYKQISKNTKFDKYMKGLFAAWLSGPATTLRNIFGSLGNITSDITSKAFNPKTAKELPTAISNLYRDFVEKGLPEGKAILKGDQYMDSKFATFDPSFPLPADAFSAPNRTLYDRVTESVGRWLNAQDIALSTTVKEMEKRSLRIYKPDISDDVAKAISDMYGLSSVYRGIPRGRAIRALVMGAETLTREAPGFKLLIPFIRTIGNVLDRQFDYMPIFSTLRMRESVLLGQARTIAKKYGIKNEPDVRLIMQRLKDQQTGRMYMGLAVSAAATVAAKEGLISGNGPKNYNERVMLERTGWRRNSIKIGNKWVPYTYIGPLAGILSLAGNIHDAIEYENASDKDISSLLTAGLVGWMNTQLNSSFLKGTADLLDVLMGNTQPNKYFSNLGASLVPVPALYTQTMNIGKNAYSRIVDDPSLRQQYESRNVIDALRIKLGLTGSVLGMPAMNPRSDMFGEPMTLDLIYGLTPTTDKMDKMPVEHLLINNGVVVTIPSRGQLFTIKGKERKLEPEEYAEYVEKSGQYIYEQLTRQLPTLSKLKREELQDRVEMITRTQRARARAELLR